MKIVELQELKAKHVADARKIIDRADAEKREMTAEEGVQADNHFAESDALEAKIESAQRKERLASAEDKLKEKTERVSRGQARGTDGDAPDHAQAFRSWFLRNRGNRLTAAEIGNAQRCGVELDSGANTFALAKRSVSKTSSAGTATTGWTEFYDGFEKELKYYGPMMNLVTIRPSTSGQPLPIPVIDDTANMATEIGEGQPVASADPAGTSVTLGGYKYTSQELVLSLEVLQDSAIDLESEVTPMLGERFGRTFNQRMTVGLGSGSGQPFGICGRASASGVVSGGSAAAPTFASPDAFLDLVDSLDIAYQGMPGCGYMMHQTIRSKLRKLKDTTGQYLWQPSAVAGAPSVFNGFPVYLNPDMPTSGVSAPLALFGDYKQYIWRMVLAIEIHKLDQLRMLNGQISFVGFARADGNLKKPSAVKKLLAPAT